MPAAASLQPVIQRANLTRDEKYQIMKRDPYKWAQLQARKAAKVKRQDEVQAARDAKWGDPVHGITTPFVESFDSAGQANLSTPPVDDKGNPLNEPHALPTSPHMLNNHLTKAELDEAIEAAYKLTKPLQAANRSVADPTEEALEMEKHEERHRKASIALERISAIDNGSSKNRLHANIRRCVDTFGRHNTDLALRPKPLARGMEGRDLTPRAGPDTGSSEVQIAILTAKIRVLAQAYEGRKGYKDKFNRRNLRLLCHRRQRLLKYMEKKERGGERWTHMIESLGLSPATWKKQIEV